jgi:hypothetical protein
MGQVGPASWLALPLDLSDQFRELEEIGDPKVRPTSGYNPVAVGCAQVGPFGGDTQDRAIRALKDDPSLLAGVSPIQQGEALSAERMEGMSHAHHGILGTVRSSLG